MWNHKYCPELNYKSCRSTVQSSLLNKNTCVAKQSHISEWYLIAGTAVCSLGVPGPVYAQCYFLSIYSLQSATTGTGKCTDNCWGRGHRLSQPCHGSLLLPSDTQMFPLCFFSSPLARVTLVWNLFLHCFCSCTLWKTPIPCFWNGSNFIVIKWL